MLQPDSCAQNYDPTCVPRTPQPPAPGMAGSWHPNLMDFLQASLGGAKEWVRPRSLAVSETPFGSLCTCPGDRENIYSRFELAQSTGQLSKAPTTGATVQGSDIHLGQDSDLLPTALGKKGKTQGRKYQKRS